MERKKIEVPIDIVSHSNSPITWKQLKDFKFEDDDKINVGYREGHYSENNSWDPYYSAEILRTRLETDEEMEKRIKNSERDAKWAREKRYENYLRLKKEFENEEQK